MRKMDRLTTLTINNMNLIHVLLVLNILLQSCTGWLWWNPASEIDTFNKCKEMKESNSLWYPTYCESLIAKQEGNEVDEQQTTRYDGYATTRPPNSTNRLPTDITGWGWSEWGEWGDGGCPEICGRRCNRRARYCTGPYHLICKGRGAIQDYDDCEELENTNNGNGFERKTTVPDFNPNKGSDILNMINQMQHNAGNGVGDFPDYQDSVRNLMEIDTTLQQLHGMLGNAMNLERKDRFKKKRLIKPKDKNSLSVRAIPQNKMKAVLLNSTFKDSSA